MKWLLLLAVIMETGLSLIILSYVSSRAVVVESIALAESPSSYRQNQVVPPALPITTGLPKTIIIPRISIRAPLTYVGLNADGEMDVRKKPDDVGWYSLGTRPGDVGAAVIAGHSGWRDNIPAIFDHLDQLELGDEVMVEDEHGNILSFIVKETRHYDPQADATEVFNPRDGKKYLNLITCVGLWDSVAKTYSQRLVVFAEQV